MRKHIRDLLWLRVARPGEEQGGFSARDPAGAGLTHRLRPPELMAWAAALLLPRCDGSGGSVGSRVSAGCDGALQGGAARAAAALAP